MKTLISFFVLMALFSSCGTKTEDVPGSLSTELIELKDYTVELEFLYEVKENEDQQSGKIIFLTTAMQEIKDKCFFKISPDSLNYHLDDPSDYSDWNLGMTLNDEGNQFGFISTSGIDKSVHHRWVREDESFKTVIDLREPKFGKIQFTCKAI